MRKSLPRSFSSAANNDILSISSQCGAMVSKVHLDYATHEMPLPLFGFGHDWADTSLNFVGGFQIASFGLQAVVVCRSGIWFDTSLNSKARILFL